MNEICVLEDGTFLYINQTLRVNFYGDYHNPECDNPSTTIHKFVEILNGLKK